MIKDKQSLLAGTLTVALMTLVHLLFTTTAYADGPDYTMDRWAAAGGGGTCTSVDGSYTLNGTIGQPDAGALLGEDYTLGGGFWGGGEITEGHTIYLPLVMRGS